jgi:hypothetical protein
MTRNLKTYVKNKKNSVSTAKKSSESYAPCYLCDNQELPDLDKTIDGTFGKTCEDVHMELLSMQKEKHASICLGRQELYQKTCCPKQNGSGLGKPSKTAFMTIFGAFVFWIVIKKLGGGRKGGRVAASDDEPSTYKEMDDDPEEARDEFGSRSRSRSRSQSRKKHDLEEARDEFGAQSRSLSRSQSRKKHDPEEARDEFGSLSRSRSRSQSRKMQKKRSKSREPKSKKNSKKSDPNLCCVNAVLAAEARNHPTQVV